jgi:hypothetical protein
MLRAAKRGDAASIKGAVSMPSRRAFLVMVVGAVISAPFQMNSAGAVATTTIVTRVNPQGGSNTTPFATSIFGQPVVVTATVTAASGGVAPDGSVAIQTFGTTCNATLAPQSGLLAAGTCTLPPPPLASGVFPVGASYTGTTTFEASTSAESGTNGSLTVSQASTITTITSDTPDPSNVSVAYAVAATVAVVAPGAGTPTGTILVSEGSSACVITLPATSCNLASSTPGIRTLTATYGGDLNFQGSASAGVPHTVAATTSSTSAIPTLSEYALLLMAVMLATLGGALSFRRRR